MDSSATSLAASEMRRKSQLETMAVGLLVVALNVREIPLLLPMEEKGFLADVAEGAKVLPGTSEPDGLDKLATKGIQQEQRE